MIHETADQGVGHQACCGDAAVDDLWFYRFLHQDLAAPARLLATNVAVHEELGRDDVQTFADVFCDAHYLPGALGCRAQGAFGLMVMFHAHQVLGQRLALGLAAWLISRCGNWRQVLHRFELSLRAGLVGGQGFFEQLALLGVHGLGAGGKLSGLQAGQLEGDALERGGLELELSLAPGDELVARGDDFVLLGNVLTLLTDARQHLLRQCGQFRRTEVTQSA